MDSPTDPVVLVNRRGTVWLYNLGPSRGSVTVHGLRTLCTRFREPVVERRWAPTSILKPVNDDLRLGRFFKISLSFRMSVL